MPTSRRQRNSRYRVAALSLVLSVLIAVLVPVLVVALTTARADVGGYRVEVWGSDREAIDYWKQRDFWGAFERGQTLSVPRTLTVAINKSWKQESQRLPVADKKALFYRAMLPLVLANNELILQDRERLLQLAGRHRAGVALSVDDRGWLRRLAGHYRVIDKQPGVAPDADLLVAIEELLQRVDIVPPGLALGQGAYESGYATSRFALTGNALFGVWTWGGDGMKPKQPRKGKGDYGVAAYDWPFDSVRAYLLNLNTQRAYAQLRRERAKLRRQGDKLTALALVGTLSKYSERGQAYVETLAGMIRKNRLDAADDARLRDETTVLVVGAEDRADKTEVEQEVARLRASGELDTLIESMGLQRSH